MEDGKLKKDFYKMISLIEPLLNRLSTENRAELEILLADIANEISKMQEDIEIYKELLTFMKEWDLTPEETIKLLKTSKGEKKRE